jgi:hypothetical protein
MCVAAQAHDCRDEPGPWIDLRLVVPVIGERMVLGMLNSSVPALLPSRTRVERALCVPA